MIYIPVLSAAFFGSTALPYEYERGTIYSLSSLPVNNMEIIMSKITGATFLSFLSTMILVFFQVLFFILHFRALPGITFLVYILLILLVTFSDVCFAVAVSAFFKNSGYSSISFLIIYLVVLDILSLIATGSGVISPVFIKTNTDRIIYRVFLNADPYFLTYTFSLSPLKGIGLIYISTILVFYSVVTILIGYVIFSLRRSLK
ncbi:ABC transporter permease [Cuniculiplasma sp. SKW3]|uniref:ABC transporter permease n=1 Tax=Cuniculiplasma sp. SKW3 TaxID=3400170 RepID=UPI003FD4CBB4